jgi:hypothetical protein
MDSEMRICDLVVDVEISRNVDESNCKNATNKVYGAVLSID